MRTIFIAFFIAAVITSCTPAKESLFNGKNLDGWTITVKDSSVSPEDFFYVNDGVIETIGVPNGYLRTVKEYSNYKLHVEWRYPENPVNSGVFVHTTGPDKIWPDYYQAQLKYGDAGVFILQGPGVSATLNDTVYVADEQSRQIPKLHPSNEKPAGEWNSYDIICKGNTIELWVNGLLQNTATDCSLTKGGIGLQAEGSKIQFRNLWIEPLD